MNLSKVTKEPTTGSRITDSKITIHDGFNGDSGFEPAVGNSATSPIHKIWFSYTPNENPCNAYL